MTFFSIITSRHFRRIVLLIWVCIIFWLSLDPAPPALDAKIIGWDKFLHAVAYGCLTLFAGWAIKGPSPPRISTWITIAVSATFLGGVMEIFQMVFTTNRSAEFADFLSDAFGSVIVLLVVFGIRKYRCRHACSSCSTSDPAGLH
ncbi:MAG: VanZ family protein [Geobacteraceae bacterium]